jgi:hypothetical protein
VTQVYAKFVHSVYPAIARLISPMLALIGVAIKKQMAANLATEFGVENVLHPFDHRLIAYAPTIASSELPVAIAVAVAIEPAVVALAITAAMKIAGQARYPHTSTAASAKPVGGQIGVALGLMEASASPPFARAK